MDKLWAMQNTIKLYEFAHSPYCIPVAQALTALGQKYERVAVHPATRTEVIELTKGAYYQVPVLEHGQTVVAESGGDTTDIAAYIDKHFAGGRLFPEPTRGLQALLIRYIENDLEGLTFRLADPFYIETLKDTLTRALVIRHKERKFGKGCVEKWRAEREQLFAEAEQMLMPFESILQHRQWLLAEQPVFADFALYGIIGNMCYNNWNTLPKNLPNLIKWNERLEAWRY